MAKQSTQQELELAFESQEWDLIKKEVNQCYSNALDSLQSPACEQRELYAGKCAMAREILGLENKYRRK